MQVMSMLTGLFWHVEHDAFYKPRDPGLRGADRNAVIRTTQSRFEEQILDSRFGHATEATPTFSEPSTELYSTGPFVTAPRGPRDATDRSSLV